MPKPSFKTSDNLATLIDAYFKHIRNVDEQPEKDVEELTAASKKNKNPEPRLPTFTGLALFLGFNSLKAFDDYQRKGKFAGTLKRGRLRVEFEYEKKLHASATGAQFVLKSVGWTSEKDNTPSENKTPKTMEIAIRETGPKLQENEKDVLL